MRKYLTSDEYTSLEVGEMKDFGVFDNPKFKVSIENIMKNVQGYGRYRQDLIEKWGGDDFVNLYKTELETLSSAGDAYKKASAKYSKWAMDEPKAWKDAQEGLGAKYDLENLGAAGSVAWGKLDKAQKHYTTSKGQYEDYIKSEDYLSKGKTWFKAKGDYEDAQTAFSTAKTAWQKAKTPYDTALSDFQATVDPFETASAAHQPNLEAYTSAEKTWKDALSAFTSAGNIYTDAETASSTAKDFYSKAFKRYQSANTAYQSASQGFSTAQNLYNKYAGNTGYLALAKGGVGRAQSALTGAMSSMARFQSGYAGERTRAMAGATPRTARRRKRVSPLLGYA